MMRGTVGSTLHGLHHGGQDDRDEMAIFLEPPEFLVGLRLARSGRSSGPSSTTSSGPNPKALALAWAISILSRNSLRKWLRLALAGNPTVILLLFSPPESLLVCTDRGLALRELAPAIVSRLAGPRYVGYMQAQKERLLDTRGQRRVNRPELIQAHGYDTKYAMHVARLGLQGIELMTTGCLTLPMTEPDRSRVMAIRRGETPFDEAVADIEDIERRLHVAADESPLPDTPDYVRVDQFVIDSYRDAWGWG